MTDRSFYLEMRNAADEILSEFGQELTFRHYSQAVFDPSTGKMSRLIHDQSCLAVLFPVSNSLNSQSTGDKIRFGDQEVYLSSLGISNPPAEGDELLEWQESAPWTIPANNQIAFTTAGSRIVDASGDNGFALAKVGENIAISGSNSNNQNFIITDLSDDGSFVQVYPTPSNEDAGAMIQITAKGIDTAWSVVACEPLEPTGLVVYYDLFVRKIQP